MIVFLENYIEEDSQSFHWETRLKKVSELGRKVNKSLKTEHRAEKREATIESILEKKRIKGHPANCASICELNIAWRRLFSWLMSLGFPRHLEFLAMGLVCCVLFLIRSWPGKSIATFTDWRNAVFAVFLVLVILLVTIDMTSTNIHKQMWVKRWEYIKQEDGENLNKMKNRIYIERFGHPIEKKKTLWPYIIPGILVIVFLIIAGFIIQCKLASYVTSLPEETSNYSTWISSLASYWGAIIGGVISGGLAFFGVAITIKYYRDSDAAKAKMEYMPFLKIDYIGQASAPGTEPVFEIDTNESESEYGNPHKFKIKNIGRDFAYTVVIHTGSNIGGQAFNKTILVNEETEFYIKLKKSTSSVEFGLQFIDCMRNEYYQKYQLEDGKVECGFPVEMAQ